MKSKKCEITVYTRSQSLIYAEEEMDTFNEIEQYNNDSIKSEFEFDVDDLDEKELNETKEEAQVNKNAQEDKEFFLLYYIPKLPNPLDERYQIIKKYVSNDFAQGMEKKRCLEFEIMARDKENVYAIENAILFYNNNYNYFKNYNDREPISNYNIYNRLKNLLKELRLIEYKYYQEHDKFIHWAINPFIYEIINFFTYNENPEYGYKVIPLATAKNGNYLSRQVDSLTQIEKYTFPYYYNFKINTLSNIGCWHKGKYITCKLFLPIKIIKWSLNNVKAIPIYKLPKYSSWYQSFSKIYDATTSMKEVQISESSRKSKFTKNLSYKYNEEAMLNKIIYNGYYPKIREHSKIVIEIEYTANKDVLQRYLEKVIDRLDEKNVYQDKESIMDNEISPLPQSLLSITRPKIGDTKYQDKFFYYDYYKYRKEQIEHQEKYKTKETFINEQHPENSILFDDLSSQIQNQYFEKYTLSVNKANKFLIDKLRLLLKSKKVTYTKSDIYREIRKTFNISYTDKIIRGNINDIEELVEESKSTNLFINNM